MDSKAPLLPQTEYYDEVQPPRRSSATRFSRFHAAGLAILFAVFWLARSWQCDDPTHHHYGEESNETKVPLEVHIMSKCADARDCLGKLVVPAMANVSDKVDFKLSFIGNTTSEDDGVQCPHGQTECLGNILELCAASSYPNPRLYLGFTMCLSRQYAKIPSRDLVQDCALEHGLDFDVLNECMSKDDGAYGMGMLRDSVQRSADVNATVSCTVRLDGEKWCLRDGGEWKGCDEGSRPKDLIREIEKKFDEAKGWSE